MNGRRRATSRLLALVCASGGCCCSGTASTSGSPSPVPAVVALPVPPPVSAAADTITEMEMRNVDFHLDDSILLHIRRFRGRARDLSGEHIIVLDDKRRLELHIAYAEMGITAPDLSDLLNRYVFGYRGSPLRSLKVRYTGAGIEQSGILHKVVDIPFDMKATATVTPEGLIRLRPTSMKICSIPGMGLLDALHITLEKLIDVRGAKGVTVHGNDLLLDPVRILPPPRIEGRLTGLSVQGDQLVQVFGSSSAPGTAALDPPVGAPNYVLFRGGTLRFGKLYMIRSELEAIDQDASNPFEFDLDHYSDQLVAGYHRTLPDGGLAAWMPDYARIRRAHPQTAAAGIPESPR